MGVRIERARGTVREGDLFLHVDGVRYYLEFTPKEWENRNMSTQECS